MRTEVRHSAWGKTPIRHAKCQVRELEERRVVCHDFSRSIAPNSAPLITRSRSPTRATLCGDNRVRRERVEREGARLPRLLAVHRNEQPALDHAERIARERVDEVTRRGLGLRAGQRLLVACQVEQLGEHRDRDEVRDAGGAEVAEAGLDAEGAALIVDRNQRRDDRERVEALRRKRRTVDLSKISQQMALIQCCKQKRS